MVLLVTVCGNGNRVEWTAAPRRLRTDRRTGLDGTLPENDGSELSFLIMTIGFILSFYDKLKNICYFLISNKINGQ
jgi:hypothetical protein